MISIEVAIRHRLVTSPAVSALLGDRIEPSFSSEQTRLPRAVYTRLISDHQHHMGGASGLVFVRVQIDIFADTFSEMEQIGEAVRNRLDGFRGNITVGADTVWLQQVHLEDARDQAVDPTDGSDRGIFRRLLDFRISAAESIPVLTN